MFRHNNTNIEIHVYSRNLSMTDIWKSKLEGRNHIYDFDYSNQDFFLSSDP